MARKWRQHWWARAALGAAVAVILAYIVAERMERANRPQELISNEVGDWVEQRRTNYSQIEDGLYLGGYVPQPPPGVRAVLNLYQSKDRYAAEVHRWDPIDDGPPAPGLEWLGDQVEFIDSQRRAGLPVYVHCFAGISRSAMVVTAYLMARNGWRRDQALAFIRIQRPVIRPNPAFMELLLEWEQLVNP